MSNKKVLIICISILVIASLVIFLIFSSEPTAKTEAATKQMAMLVEVEPVTKGSFQPVFLATGTVRPVEDIILSPLVEGQVVRRTPAFSPGGFVEKGTLLLQIDPSDYRYIVELRKADLQQAQTELQMEMGRQEVAENDLELIGGDSLSEQEIQLVLRKPQLNAVRARIESAKAALEQAQLNLTRTSIRAPFDAHILSQNVTSGSLVSPGDNLGRLVGSDYYWVDLTVPVSTLKWLNFDDQKTTVKIRNSTAWQEDQYRTGYLEQLVGALDDNTRLAKVLVKVPDPLAVNGDKPELMIGAFVEVYLLGEEIDDVVRIDRNLIRNNNTVWINSQDSLQIREVEILLKDAEYAYISKGLSDNEMLISTNLSTVTNGIPLRTKEEDTIQK